MIFITKIFGLTAQAAELPTFSSTAPNLPVFISSVYSFALTIVGIAVFVRILWAGFLWLTAAGNLGKATDARNKIKNAVIGAILLFAAYLILYVINPDLVQNTFNFSVPDASVNRNVSGPGTGGPGAAPDGSIPSGAFANLRYLKIETVENGWVSWREIEIYDSDGNKLKPVMANGKTGFFYSPTTNGFEKAYDGDPETSWNAGETNPKCGISNPQCPGSVRDAFIVVHLGGVFGVSKIRLMQNGDTSTEVTKVFVSADGQTYQLVATFSAPMSDRQWLEYP